MSAFNTILPCVMTLIGPLLLFLGWRQYIAVNAFVAKAQRTSATYVGKRVEASPNTIGSASAYRQYRFATPDGRTFGCSSIVGGARSTPNNQTVEVLYDPKDPNTARINTWLELYGGPAILLACGAMFLIVAPIIGVLLVLLK